MQKAEMPEQPPRKPAIIDVAPFLPWLRRSARWAIVSQRLQSIDSKLDAMPTKEGEELSKELSALRKEIANALGSGT